MKYPAYQINIPAAVRFDKSLSANVKLLYGEIKALCDQQGYCWARNEYLATLSGVQIKVVSRWINLLRKKGYLQVEICKGNQRKIYVESDLPEKDRSLHLSVDGILSKVESDLPQNRSDVSLHLINNLIDYNDRVHSASTLDLSTLKWREQGEKKPDGSSSSSREAKRQTSTSPPVAPVPPPKQTAAIKKFIKPSVSEVEEYMKSQAELCPDSLTTRGQALRFVNYYEANGWKVGRNDMQDWQAAANNWLLNSQNHTASKSSSHERLHTTRNKDYSIPL